MVLSLSLFTSQSPWWFSDYPYTHESLPGGTQTIPIHISLSGATQTVPVLITDSLVLFKLSLYTSKLPVGTQSIPISPWLNSDYPYTHHLHPCCTKTIPLLITVSLVVLRLSLYTSKSPWWYSDYPYTHHILPGGSQTIPIHKTVCLVVLRLSPNTSESSCGAQTIQIHITVYLVELSLSLCQS